MKIAKNQAELIGNTPILKIPSLSKITGCEILVKCESFNPGGSIKDDDVIQRANELNIAMVMTGLRHFYH